MLLKIWLNFTSLVLICCLNLLRMLCEGGSSRSIGVSSFKCDFLEEILTNDSCFADHKFSLSETRED